MWALTEQRALLYREGVSSFCPEGEQWKCDIVRYGPSTVTFIPEPLLAKPTLTGFTVGEFLLLSKLASIDWSWECSALLCWSHYRLCWGLGIELGR